MKKNITKVSIEVVIPLGWQGASILTILALE